MDPDGAYWNTTHAPFYCDGGVGSVGTFRNDTEPGCWTDNRPMANIKARGGGDDEDDDYLEGPAGAPRRRSGQGSFAA